MEFKRGKTFIKSSMHLPHEKLPLVGLSPREKDSIGRVSKEMSHAEVEIQKANSSADKNYRISTRSTKIGSSDSALLIQETFYKPVRKSKTHDCALGAGKADEYSYSIKNSDEAVATPGKTKGRLISSVSFSGLGNTQNSSDKRESAVNSNNFLNSQQQMIDYRNFVPQMPFVPAVAKSIPRKRISLKRSKKGFRDIFHIKKNKPENLALLSEKQRRLPFPGSKSELAGRFGKYFFKAGETFSADCLGQDFSDAEMLSESSYEYSSTLCEDVASLKSFDSLTGCGEIFADESSAHMELEINKEILLRQTKQKENPAMGSFQGGVEQLASPAQNEAADFAKLWDNINKSVQLHQKALFDRRLLKIPSSELGKATDETDSSVTDLLSSPDSSKEYSIDTGTPKSDNQESMSTSDEGYYDSFSPGQDEDIRDDQSPRVPGRFPRDSYSGDALYELFCDPNEAQSSPVLDDDLCMSESISEKAIEIPLSIYSFHVGSEENMASQPAVDIISQGFLHSSWKGKECLLKLCDTELSLTMGIISWLQKNPGLISPQDFPKSPSSQLEKVGQPMSSTPSTCQNMCKKTLEETKNHIQESLVDSKNETYTYSADRFEKGQHDMLSSNSSQDCSQGREGNLSAMSWPTMDSSMSCDMQRSQDSWDDLQASSSEMKISFLEECTEPSTDTPSLDCLNLDSISQTEDPLVMDNHDAESCSSYMTAATSPDSLETGDESEAQDQSWSIACDKPIETQNYSHSQSHVSQTPKENDTNIKQLLDHCVTQVASIQISCEPENADLEEKCIGNEVSNNATTLAQLKKEQLLQNGYSGIVPSPKDPVVHAHSNLCNSKENSTTSPLNGMTNARMSVYQESYLKNEKEGLISFEDQKNSSILDCMGPPAKNKITFEYAQLNNQALSYIKDFRFDLCTQNPTATEHIYRPTFLPLFSSICSDPPSGFMQSLYRKNSSLEKNSHVPEITSSDPPLRGYPKLQCKVLPQMATLPSPEEMTKEKALTEKKAE